MVAMKMLYRNLADGEGQPCGKAEKKSMAQWSRDMFQEPLSPSLRPFLWLAVYLLPAFTIREPLVEYDTGWHLRSGAWIIEHQQIPTADPFTTVGDDRPWIAYSWLFGVLMDRLYLTAGLPGILVWRVLMSVAIVAALHAMVARRQASMLMQLFIVAGAAIALTRTFLGERPGLFTILFAILTLEAILRILERKPLGIFWLLPFVYALWANMHIQFVHGLVLIGVAGLGCAIDWARSRQGGAALGPLILLGTLCGLATLVNPYGVHLYEVVLNYGGNREIYELFAELKSLEFRSPADWAVLGMFAAAVFASSKRPDGVLSEFLLLAAGAFLSFHAKHEVWIVVAIAAAILARWRLCERDAERLGPRDVVFIGIGVGCFASAWLVFGSVSVRLQETWQREFPEAAMDAWMSQPGGTPDGPIFVNIEWGAYVSWRSPQNRIVIDGRAQLHGGPRVKRLHDVVEGLPGWERDPDLLSAKAVVLPRRRPLAELLQLSPAYHVFYRDDAAIVFTRK
jgi:hypothetical protein